MLNEKIKECITKHSKFIVDVIMANCTEQIISIYLYGSYGRDEGGWVINGEDNNITVAPYNDYDIALIVNKKISQQTVLQLEKNLKDLIDIQYIDISQYTLDEMSKLSPVQKNYDLKYASKWLYGRDDVLDVIPKIKPADILLKDLETLYATRLHTLVGSFDANGLNPMCSEKEMEFRNQMAKAVLAIVDCVLIPQGAYHWSYRKRVSILNNYTDDKNLQHLAKWALEEKKFPKSKGMTADELHSLYEKVSATFFKYFFKGLGNYWNKSITTVADLHTHLILSPTNFLKNKISKFIFHDNRREKGAYLIILQSYIALDYPTISPQDMEKCINILANQFSITNIGTLDELRLAVMKLRLNK